MFSWAVNNSW
uniref:Uncharacterized protein n=1 Tax=Arundo donax TaxID=35708 RepID=A0A0A9B6B3_ARUDO